MNFGRGHSGARAAGGSAGNRISKQQLAMGLLLCAGLALTGCLPTTVERDPASLPSPPERWAAGGEPAEASSTSPDHHPPALPTVWWDAFDDPQLQSILETALESNPDLLATAARVEASGALARSAAGAELPTISAGADGSRSRINFLNLPFEGSTTANRFESNVTVSWELDVWGRLAAATRAAVADYQASQADYAALQLSLTGQVARTWFAIVEAQRQVDLARESADNFERTTRIVRSRYERGVRPSVDLRLALSNQSSAEASFHQRRAQLDSARRNLEVLIGRYPGGTAFLEEARGARLELPPRVPIGLPGELIGRRPDLLAAERRLTAAEQRWLVARRARYPQLVLTGSGGTSSDELGDLVDGDFRVWNVLGNLLQPLFQGGRIRAEIDRTEATISASLADYAGAALSAYAEVETALRAETLLRDQLTELQTTADQLDAASTLAVDRYISGVGSYLEVLDAQSRAFTARSNELATRRALLDNRVNLHLALGGGFTPADLPDATIDRSVAGLDDVKPPRPPVATSVATSGERP